LENVVIKFIADTDGLKPAIDQLKLLGKITEEDAKAIAEINAEQKEFLNTINRTTTEAGKLNAEIEDLGKTMSNDVIGKAADELNNFTKESNQAVQGAKSLKAELRELKKQIASGDFTGEELRQMTKRAAELEDHLGDVSERIKTLSSDTKYVDALAGAMKGVAAAASVAAGASALFGSENEDLAKATQKAPAAMALLAVVQELSILVTSENAAKTIFLDSAQKLATASSRVLGVTITTSMAAATMGLSLVIAAFAAFAAGMGESTSEVERLEKRVESFKKTQDLLAKTREEQLKLIKNELNSVFIALHSTTPAKAVSWLDATVMLRWSNGKQQQHQQAQVTERSGPTVFPQNAHGSTKKV
jgi:myosin heavy subunit